VESAVPTKNDSAMLCTGIPANKCLHHRLGLWFQNPQYKNGVLTNILMVACGGNHCHLLLFHLPIPCWDPKACVPWFARQKKKYSSSSISAGLHGFLRRYQVLMPPYPQDSTETSVGCALIHVDPSILL